MFAKSFIALDGNGCLIGASTAQTAAYDRYACHLCGSVLQYHPEYDTERPWFKHTFAGFPCNGLHHFLYVNPNACWIGPLYFHTLFTTCHPDIVTGFSPCNSHHAYCP